MGLIAIIAYKPKFCKEAALLKVVNEHVPILRAEGLATDRPPIFGRARNGTIIEIFEWKSEQAINDAHSNARVAAMWGEFNAACTYETLATLEECKQMFAGFEAIEL